jgi:tetratricopeptide (TPR) repeat protein
MEAAASGAAADSPAQRLLVKQERLVGWQIAGERMGFLLKALLGVGGIAVAFGLAGMVWQAAHARGVVIEAFSVPPDFAEKGLTGEVVAGQLQDRLMALQAQTGSARAADTYANNWGRDIKVVIPQTGVSIGELQRYLRDWLGHETHVNGEVFRTPTGLSLTVRANGEAGDPVAAGEAELDKLLTDGALALYKKTQTYRWVVYQAKHGGWEQARPVAEQLAAGADRRERGWAYNNLRANAETVERAVAYAREGLAIAPETAILWDNVSGLEFGQGHVEAALHDAAEAITLWKRKDRGGYSAEVHDRAVKVRLAQVAGWTGDHQSSLKYSASITGDATALLNAKRSQARSLAFLHEPSAALKMLDPLLDDAEMLATTMQPGGEVPNLLNLTRYQIAREQGDWAEAYRQAAGDEALINKPLPTARYLQRYKDLSAPNTWPAMAEALAHLGQIDEAKALAARTPTDCYQCLRTRAVVAELAGDRAGADRWFAEAVRQAPHFNAAQTEWGQALLARGQPDAAIAQFKAANKIGPRFADPLEGWGEALMAKGDFKGAAAKFEQAAAFAPRWGRLHLKWGQALAKLGQLAEAQAQFKAAAALDLTPADRAELARVGAR